MPLEAPSLCRFLGHLCTLVPSLVICLRSFSAALAEVHIASCRLTSLGSCAWAGRAALLWLKSLLPAPHYLQTPGHFVICLPFSLNSEPCEGRNCLLWNGCYLVRRSPSITLAEWMHVELQMVNAQLNGTRETPLISHFPRFLPLAQGRQSLCPCAFTLSVEGWCGPFLSPLIVPASVRGMWAGGASRLRFLSTGTPRGEGPGSSLRTVVRNPIGFLPKPHLPVLLCQDSLIII